MIRAARGGGGLSMALTHLVISQFLLPHSFLFLIALGIIRSQNFFFELKPKVTKKN